MIDEIDKLLRDYQWMRKVVEGLQQKLYGHAPPMRSWGVAQYGIEATLPKGSPGLSQVELKNLDLREERLHERLSKYESRVYVLETGADYLEDEMHKVIYDCLLDGMSYRSIADLLGITRNQAKEAKKAILNELSQNFQFVSLLKLEKSEV